MNLPLAIVHIAGAGTALVGGYGALFARKGSPLHRRAGLVFVAGLALGAVAGIALGALKPDRSAILSGTLVLYLLLSALLAVRDFGARTRPLRAAATALACACLAEALLFAGLAAQSPAGRLDGYPRALYLILGAIALLGLLLDLHHRRARPEARRRLARHAWRMGAAFLIAALSFFFGQQKHMPAAIQGSPLLYLPPAAILVLVAWWLVRLRPRRAAAAPADPLAAG